MAIYRVKEVLNYGGFFGGDTISAILEPYEGGAEQDITIDEHVFDNLKDRYKVLTGFMLALEMDGSRVTQAKILAAPTLEQLRAAITPDNPSEKEAYHVFAYKCSAEHIWVRGAPEQVDEHTYRCLLCGAKFRS